MFTVSQKEWFQICQRHHDSGYKQGQEDLQREFLKILGIEKLISDLRKERDKDLV